MEDRVMEDFTKEYLKKRLIVDFVTLVILLFISLFCLDRGAVIASIIWGIVFVVGCIIISFELKGYFIYKHNRDVFEGTITNVSVNMYSYQIVIKCDDRNYIASYYFMFTHIHSSYMKDKVGRKCSFIVNKRGKAYIRYYL